ncbi:hypothetical protein C5N14_30810 [Micromonospora sp. MW-13]|nr:hypothetical protein C5N14_30810 [Micromonospora sp. MW-13]
MPVPGSMISFSPCASAVDLDCTNWWNALRSGTTNWPPTCGIVYTTPLISEVSAWENVAAPPRVISADCVSYSTSQVRLVCAVWAKIAPRRVRWSKATGTRKLMSTA